jgi:hypothetical protein
VASRAAAAVASPALAAPAALLLASNPDISVKDGSAIILPPASLAVMS